MIANRFPDRIVYDAAGLLRSFHHVDSVMKHRIVQKAVARAASVGLFAAAALFLWLTQWITQNAAHLPVAPLLYPFCLMFALLFGVFALSFYGYGTRPGAVVRRVVWNLARLERPADDGRSLLSDVVEYCLYFAAALGGGVAVFEATADFTYAQHLWSIAVGNTLLFAYCVAVADARSPWRRIGSGLAAVAVLGAFPVLWLIAGAGTPAEAHRWAAEVVTWGLIWPMLIAERTLRGLRAWWRALPPPRSMPLFAMRHYWRTSTRILERTATTRRDALAIATTATLLIFVVPDHIAAVVPDHAETFFTDVWNRLGPLNITKDHVSYVTVAIVIVMMATEYARMAPSPLGPGRSVNGLVDGVMFTPLLTIAFIVFIAPPVVLAWSIGYAVFADDLAIVLGLFAFPVAAQRLLALMLAAFLLSFETTRRGGADPKPAEASGTTAG
jgi:hypothetical protein